jgi:hypothetical protein
LHAGEANDGKQQHEKPHPRMDEIQAHTSSLLCSYTQ